MVQMDPSTYVCTSHGVDLTPQVKELLDEDAMPVAYDRLRLLRGRSRRRVFEFLVSCPGDGTADGVHQQPCEGEYWT